MESGHSTYEVGRTVIGLAVFAATIGAARLAWLNAPPRCEWPAAIAVCVVAFGLIVAFVPG